MRRKYLAFLYVACAAVTVTVFAAQVAFAQGLRYQDANELEAEGAVNIAPPPGISIPDAIVSTLPDPNQVPPPDQDNKWNFRDFGAGATIFQSGIAEDSPYLRQTLSGLTPNQSYDLYAVYWTDEDENWTIRTGLSSGNMNLYSWTGASGGSPVAGSTQGIAASTAVWATPPPATKDPTGTIFIEPRDDAAGALVMLLGYAGTASANASGQLDVFVDDNPNAGGVRRSWFDGIAYVNAGPTTTNIAATATLDRTTGTLTLNNPTSQNLQIKSYRIAMANAELATPPSSGALNATTWTTISSSNPSWTVTSPADPPNSPFTTILSEDGGGSTVTLASGGGSLSFGNVWNKSPFDHVLVYLTLADDSLAVLASQYSGPAIVNGDLDGNGSINVTDFQTLLNNLQTTPGLPTRVENYRRGEITGDNAVNFNDWVAFRAAFNAANGAGSFEAMLASVPEPSGFSLLLIAGAVALCARRSRAACGLAVALCCSVASTTHAITLLKVDVDARAGDSVAGPPGPNTGEGFSS